MSDHLWFVPVTGGSARGPAPPPDLTNVQWNISAYPVSPAVAAPSPPYLRSITEFTMGGGPAAAESVLNECFGRWRWISTVDEQGNINRGGQLAVGTVFASKLPLGNADEDKDNVVTWSEVDAWAKYRVNNTDGLDNIYLVINDSAIDSAACNCVPSANNIGNTDNNVWRVMTVSGAIPWNDWNSDNLRVTLTFQGTTDPDKVGTVVVDVEWFAIRLRPQG